jgi:hypothetical protein
MPPASTPVSLVGSGNIKTAHRGRPVNRSRNIPLGVLCNRPVVQRIVRSDGNAAMGPGSILVNLDIHGFISLVRLGLFVLRGGAPLNTIFGVFFPARWSIELWKGTSSCEREGRRGVSI